MGGLFEGGDEFLVGFDAGGEGVVFGDDFALFFNCGDGDLGFAPFFPVKDFASAAARMVAFFMALVYHNSNRAHLRNSPVHICRLKTT